MRVGAFYECLKRKGWKASRNPARYRARGEATLESSSGIVLSFVPDKDSVWCCTQAEGEDLTLYNRYPQVVKRNDVGPTEKVTAGNV